MNSLQTLRLLEAANDLLPLLCELDGRGRTGYAISEAHNLFGEVAPLVILANLVGVVPDAQKAVRYCLVSREKTLRLLSRRGDVSSHQSRDEEHFMYAGAILLTDDDTAISISGFTEPLDEAGSAVIAVRADLGMDEKRWERIQRASDNPHMSVYGQLTPARRPRT